MGVDPLREWIYSGNVTTHNTHTLHIFNYPLMVATPVITNVGLLWGVERRQHLLSLMLVYSRG